MARSMNIFEPAELELTAKQCVSSHWKRISDIVLASILILLVSPLLIVVSLALLVQNRGSILFAQPRSGLHGKVFQIWKFRTMMEPAGAGEFQQTKGRDDPRITPLGSWLRTFSVDELPQLYNILIGDMSLVGPRPHPVEMDKDLAKTHPDYTMRLLVRPGLTGLAQINGARGPIHSKTALDQRLQWDLAYIRDWKPLRDIWILVRTLSSRSVLQNAY